LLRHGGCLIPKPIDEVSRNQIEQQHPTSLGALEVELFKCFFRHPSQLVVSPAQEVSRTQVDVEILQKPLIRCAFLILKCQGALEDLLPLGRPVCVQPAESEKQKQTGQGCVVLPARLAQRFQRRSTMTAPVLRHLW
jgi:hypothetical protein